MNTSVNKHDAIEKLIYDEGLRIEAIDFQPGLDTETFFGDKRLRSLFFFKALINALVASSIFFCSAFDNFSCEPIKLLRPGSSPFTNAEQKNIMEIVRSNYELLKKKWYEYFIK